MVFICGLWRAAEDIGDDCMQLRHPESGIMEI